MTGGRHYSRPPLRIGQRRSQEWGATTRPLLRRRRPPRSLRPHGGHPTQLIRRPAGELLSSPGRRGRFPSDAEAVAAAPARDDVPPDDPRADLLGALAGLPEAQREVLLLRYADGLSEVEIAAVLGIPQGTVKSRAHHALRCLRSDPRARAWFEETRGG